MDRGKKIQHHYAVKMVDGDKLKLPLKMLPSLRKKLKHL